MKNEKQNFLAQSIRHIKISLPNVNQVLVSLRIENHWKERLKIYCMYQYREKRSLNLSSATDSAKNIIFLV